MKKHALHWMLICAAPLAAQTYEVGVFAGRQAYPSPQVDPSPGLTAQVKVDDQTVWALRFGYALTDLGPALLQVTAGYQPESSSPLTATLGGAPVAGQGQLKQSHWSAGAMFTLKAAVAVGAGLEFRSERLSESSDSTTYRRMWVRANAGFAFPSPLVKPFVGLEVAFPLSTTRNDFTSPADLLKSLAPKRQVGLYAGLRF